MFKVQQNRYLWVHLVGLAAVPLLLDICLAGLASAGPASHLPSAFGFQFWLVALVGIVPSAWMQIQRPFYIYSLPPLAVKPSALSEDDRRCLTVLKSWQIKALAGLTAGFSLWLLVRLYDKLPQVLPVMDPKAGFVSAIAAFFFACLFLQISVSVVRSLLIGQDTLKRVKPVESSEISSSFLILGIRIKKIFPAVSIHQDREIELPDSIKKAEAKTKSQSAEEPKTEISASGETSTIKKAQSEVENDQTEPQESVEEIDESVDVETSLLKDDSNITDESSETSLSEVPSAETVNRSEAVEKSPQEPPLVIPEIIESDKSNLERDR